MKTSVVLAIAAAKLVAGHATFQSFVIGGKDQGQHFAVQTPSNGNNPIKDVTSPLMVCNGGKATTDFVSVKAGSEITFQWHHNDPQTQAGDQDEPIAASHKGPVMVYMAKADTKGEGAVWTKIFEEGLSGGKWAVDKFIANKGQITITLPDVAEGQYYIRPEIIALHEGNRQGGAQFYNGCGQISVSGGSTALPSTGVDMTKAYSATDPGVLFDMYNGATTYKIPGPAVWKGASSGSAPAPSTPTKPASSPVASAAPSKTPSPVSSPAPVASPQPQQPAPSSSPAPAPGNGSGNGSTLPETFTITQFITWLKQQTGSKARRHARAFDF